MTRRQHHAWENASLPIPDFDPGEAVRLKTGGPVMLVEGAQQGCEIGVAWFAGEMLQRASLHPVCLERA